MYLPNSAQTKLKALGERIRIARKRRQWTIAELAKKMQVSAPTIRALEKGLPTVGLGVLFSALWVLGLDKELNTISAFNDEIGIALSNSRLPSKVRHKTRALNNDF